MTSISELRKNSATSLDQLKQKVEQESNGGQQDGGGDDRFWKPPFDAETGRGYAVIRFLPAPPGEELPWGKVMRHSFQGPTGKRYFENSLTTIGKTDPVGELNRRCWNSGVESDKEVSRGQKRQTTYFANILVVDDKANPENNGKVFLFRFGPKIYGFIEAAMYPEFDDEDPINPFDPWEGANLQLKMTGQNLGTRVVPNYDKSSFQTPSSIGSDEEIEEIWNKCHSLKQFTNDDAFKTYDELRSRLFEVLGPTVGSGVPVVEGWENAGQPAAATQPAQEKQKPAQESTQPAQETPAPTEGSKDDDYDDDLAFFEELTNGS